MLLNGMKVVRSPHMTRWVEDWSEVRSPSRARRRRRQGHKQRITYVERETQAYAIGDTIFVGPDTYDRLAKEARP